MASTIDERIRLDQELADFVSQFYSDPYGFVVSCYPWPIHGVDSPDAWQTQVLVELGEAVKARKFNGVDPVLPIRAAISSGHGIGKSVLFAWIVDWLMSTRNDCRGTVTANTNDQLEKKTWAAVREWTSKCLTAHWFEINSQIMFRKTKRATHFCSPQSCAEENSEAFAGQHAKSSSSFYLFDEASAVPTSIYEVAEGGLTDGEPFFILGGNPTRNTGAFHSAVFGAHRDRWMTHVIDSRECKFRNDALIAEWLEDYGEDSDFFRVRVRGLPPLTSELQFIDGPRIAAAQGRTVETLPDDPLVAGVDVSGGGSAWTVCRFRRGLDARTLAPIRITGEQSRDRNRVIAVLAEALSEQSRERQIAAMFVDSAFGSPIVERLHVLGHRNVHEINFGGDSPDVHFANQRAFMWGKMRDFLTHGSIPKTDNRLAQDLGAPGFHLNKRDQLVLEPKESMIKRGVASPDDGDALALTWAQAVRPDGLRRASRWAPVEPNWTG